MQISSPFHSRIGKAAASLMTGGFRPPGRKGLRLAQDGTLSGLVENCLERCCRLCVSGSFFQLGKPPVLRKMGGFPDFDFHVQKAFGSVKLRFCFDQVLVMAQVSPAPKAKAKGGGAPAGEEVPARAPRVAPPIDAQSPHSAAPPPFPEIPTRVALATPFMRSVIAAVPNIVQTCCRLPGV